MELTFGLVREHREEPGMTGSTGLFLAVGLEESQEDAEVLGRKPTPVDADCKCMKSWDKQRPGSKLWLPAYTCWSDLRFSVTDVPLAPGL